MKGNFGFKSRSTRSGLVLRYFWASVIIFPPPNGLYIFEESSTRWWRCVKQTVDQNSRVILIIFLQLSAFYVNLLNGFIIELICGSSKRQDYQLVIHTLLRRRLFNSEYGDIFTLKGVYGDWMGSRYWETKRRRKCYCLSIRYIRSGSQEVIWFSHGNVVCRLR